MRVLEPEEFYGRQDNLPTRVINGERVRIDPLSHTSYTSGYIYSPGEDNIETVYPRSTIHFDDPDFRPAHKAYQVRNLRSNKRRWTPPKREVDKPLSRRLNKLLRIAPALRHTPANLYLKRSELGKDENDTFFRRSKKFEKLKRIHSRRNSARNAPNRTIRRN